ncbi:MAG: glycoside hydrolase family 127 protein [Candidatus Aminicenantes bacterium]|nr:glycoside hydrolase family 127 protein [Candidatus Aminicenantes bacterium]
MNSSIRLFGLILMGPVIILSLAGCKKSVSKDYEIKPVPFTQVQVTDSFWLPRMETNRTVTIPFAFQKCEQTGRIENFEKAGGLAKGSFEGIRYNDSDVYKIMEGAAYSLTLRQDAELEQYMDKLIEKIAAAQEQDGYLYTARTIDPEKPPPGAGKERWSNLGSSHELYNVGHMYEAAVAYYQATGKRKFLETALKNANFIAEIFGPDKRQGFPGHQEIEIGLVKLFRVTGEEKFLQLAKFFLDQRGRIEHTKKFPEDSPFSIYNKDWYLQAHKPVIEQQEAVGHVVRGMYMFSGMADVAALTGDEDFIQAIDRIWDNVVSKKIYITGGVGASRRGESFGENYVLPNRTAYNETCAAIGNIFWNHRLFLLHGQAKYMDVLERTLYNGFLSGISLSGDRFFYPNPLESDGEYKFNQGEATRKPWFDCACCPGNISRFLPSFPGYVYAQTQDSIFVNLYVGNKVVLERDKKNKVRITQETHYPWEGYIKITLEPEKPDEFAMHLRIPGWARNEAVPGSLYSFVQITEEVPVLKVNGEQVELDGDAGYARISKTWEKGDVIELELPMPVRQIAAHEKVEADRGKVAFQRGPLLFCFEGVDNNGHVLDRMIKQDADFHVEFKPDLLNGVPTIRTQDRNSEPLIAVPYYAWSHRGVGEMAVWMKIE